MSPNEWLAIGMIAAFFVLLIIGVPVAISIAVTAFVFGYLGFGPMLFNLLPSRIYGVVTNYTFMAIPLFVFMGVMLEKSKLAEELIEVIGGLLLLAMGLYIAWLTLPWVEQSYLRNEASPNPGGLPLRWVLKALIPFGFLLLAMQGLAHALRQGFALSSRGE